MVRAGVQVRAVVRVVRPLERINHSNNRKYPSLTSLLGGNSQGDNYYPSCDRAVEVEPYKSIKQPLILSLKGVQEITIVDTVYNILEAADNLIAKMKLKPSDKVCYNDGSAEKSTLN